MRFDYIAYDDQAKASQAEAKKLCEDIEHFMAYSFSTPSRAISLALTKLEEVYMWIGKAIRDDQIIRNGKATCTPQEERSNS